MLELSVKAILYSETIKKIMKIVPLKRSQRTFSYNVKVEVNRVCCLV